MKPTTTLSTTELTREALNDNRLEENAQPPCTAWAHREPVCQCLPRHAVGSTASQAKATQGAGDARDDSETLCLLHGGRAAIQEAGSRCGVPCRVWWKKVRRERGEGRERESWRLSKDVNHRFIIQLQVQHLSGPKRMLQSVWGFQKTAQNSAWVTPIKS